MDKRFLYFSVLLCLVYGQSVAQKPGSVSWSVRTNPSPLSDTIHSIKIQSDGKIVAAGNSNKGYFMAIAVGRFNNGTPDSTFGVNGMVTTSRDSSHIVANALEIQPDGKIVVVGRYKKGTAGDFILVRYTSNGSVDSSFGINGTVQTDIGAGTFDFATASAIQADGKIVAAGGSDFSLALCRYNADGSLDSSFDLDGKVTMAAVGGATCMKLLADGKLVVCCGYWVVRLMPDGSMDRSFGVNGIATLSYYSLGMAIQSDGRILLSGDGHEFVLQRLDTAGLVDNSFGTRGIVITAGFSDRNYPRCATSVLLQADGGILAGGWAQLTQQVSKRFAIARYHSNGAPDSSFGVDGKATPYIVNLDAGRSFTAIVNNSNELVLAGTNENSDLGEWAMAGYYLGPPLDAHTVPGINSQTIVIPNPVEDIARIQSTHIRNGSWRLSLYDLTGKTLHSETVVVVNNFLDKRVSLAGLPAATYLVKLDNGTSRIIVKLTKGR